MKKRLFKTVKTFIGMIMLINSVSSNAQWVGSTPGKIYHDGLVQVEQDGPWATSIASLGGVAATGYCTHYLGFNLHRNSGNTGFDYYYNYMDNGGTAILSDHWGNLKIINKPSSGASDGTLSYTSLDNNTTMRILYDGKVIIGSGVSGWSGSYKLFVEEGILTEKVKVAIDGTAEWSDYVFNDEYQLMPLEKVETYVQKNKHLPNVPSAEEVVNNGIDLAKMDAKLLEKIEELTLYMIELMKENAALKTRINKLENR